MRGKAKKYVMISFSHYQIFVSVTITLMITTGGMETTGNQLRAHMRPCLQSAAT